MNNVEVGEKTRGGGGERKTSRLRTRKNIEDSSLSRVDGHIQRSEYSAIIKTGVVRGRKHIKERTEI